MKRRCRWFGHEWRWYRGAYHVCCARCQAITSTNVVARDTYALPGKRTESVWWEGRNELSVDWSAYFAYCYFQQKPWKQLLRRLRRWVCS